jgi:hypothetical protein
MKVLTNIIMVTLSCTVVAFLGTFAHTQDTSRIPDINRDVSAIDNSARRHIDERQPQPSQGPRNSTSYSRWSLQPTSQAPSSQFGAPPKPGDRSTAVKPSTQIGIKPSAFTAWSHRAADSGTALAPDSSRKVNQEQAPFGGLVRGRQWNGLIGSQFSNAYAPSPSPSQSPDQVSTPSREKPFGLNTGSPFTGFSSTGYPRRSKTNKSRTQSTARRRSTGNAVTSSATK